MFLENLGWELSSGPSGSYFVNKTKKEAQKDLPHYDILGLDYAADPTREIVFLAFATQKEATENAGDEDGKKLVLESYRVLRDPQKKVEYELANLSREHRRKRYMLLVLTEHRERKAAERAKAEAEAAAAAAAAAEAEAEEK
eukprot:GEMP01069130.1.p1 GENE.GEMP01069130.1~~GEMP01069130.1.p1  ORF type:complete len:142 (+),score=41.82 GEMP01069130.1:103-528(+)